MTIGGLYVIDGIDVVATLVPEESVAVRGTEACTTETQMQDREQDSIAVVDYEGPSTEAVEAYDARTGERLDSEEVRKDEPKRCESLTNLKSKWRSTNQRCE